jgi:hypothetical protein
MGWIIFAGITLLVIFLLTRSLTFSAWFTDGKLGFEVTYVFLRLFPFKQKKKRKKRVRKRSKRKSSAVADTEAAADAETVTVTETVTKTVTDEAASPLPVTETDTKTASGKNTTKTKRSAAEIIELIKSVRKKAEILYGSVGGGVRRIMRKIVVDDLFVDITVRGDDAAKTAVNYGYIGGAVYGLIAAVSSLATTYVTSCDVNCDFNGTESEFNIRCKVKIRIITLLLSGLLIGTGLFKSRKELFGKAKSGEENVKEAVDSNVDSAA